MSGLNAVGLGYQTHCVLIVNLCEKFPMLVSNSPCLLQMAVSPKYKRLMSGLIPVKQ